MDAYLYEEEEGGWQGGLGNELGAGGGSEREEEDGPPAPPSPEEVIRRIEGFALWFVEQLTQAPPQLPDFHMVSARAQGPAMRCTACPRSHLFHCMPQLPALTVS